ncbi:uncharacterized protein pimr209 [Danio rerio]|uniref:Uncharacterized protein pimr209 n=2 Tax=Danio rerio TaxID=7955 RepID=A0AC58HIY8_DANRE|nr:proteoglycan 4-like [Danio rerio]|eukprot:XP_002664841.2 proteoglycan 4-like [Danio rerio]
MLDKGGFKAPLYITNNSMFKRFSLQTSSPMSAEAQPRVSDSARAAAGKTTRSTGLEASPTAAAMENSPTDKQAKRWKKGIRAFFRRIGKGLKRCTLCWPGENMLIPFPCSDPNEPQPELSGLQWALSIDPCPSGIELPISANPEPPSISGPSTVELTSDSDLEPSLVPSLLEIDLEDQDLSSLLSELTTMPEPDCLTWVKPVSSLTPDSEIPSISAPSASEITPVSGPSGCGPNNETGKSICAFFNRTWKSFKDRVLLWRRGNKVGLDPVGVPVSPQYLEDLLPAVETQRKRRKKKKEDLRPRLSGNFWALTEPAPSGFEVTLKPYPASPEPKTDPCPAGPEPKTDPCPASPEPKTDPCPASPEPKTDTCPASPEPKTEPCPASPEPKTDTCPASPEPKTEPCPASPEPKTEPCPASPEPKTEPCPASPEPKTDPCPASPEPKTEPCPASPEPKTEPCPASPEPKTEPCPASPEPKTEPCPASPEPKTEPCPASPESKTDPCPASPEPKTDPCPASSEPVVYQGPVDICADSFSSPLDPGLSDLVLEAVSELGSSSHEVKPDLEPSSASGPSSCKLTPGPIYSWPGKGSFYSFYDVGKILGSGAYGTVKLARRRFDGQKVAVKFLKKNTWDKFINVPGCAKPLVAEVAVNLLLRKSQSPHIVQMIDWYEEPEKYILIMEYPDPCETLEMFISGKGGSLGETVARGLFRQVVLAAKHCADQSIFHKDIKSDNILINTDTLQLKLIDFGCSELIMNPTSINHEWAMKEAICSLRNLLIEMVSGGQHFMSFLTRKDDQLIPGYSKEFQDLITQCHKKDDGGRATLEQILQHQWLQQV